MLFRSSGVSIGLSGKAIDQSAGRMALKKGRLVSAVRSQSIHADAMWEPDPAPAADAKKGDSLEDAAAELDENVKSDVMKGQGAFWKAAEEFCAGKGNPLRRGAIVFRGIPAQKAEEPVGF